MRNIILFLFSIKSAPDLYYVEGYPGVRMSAAVWSYFTPPLVQRVPNNPYRTPMDVMVDVTNNLGLAILKDHSYSRGNFAFSPYGIASVLVVLYEGARGNSALQIHRSAAFPPDRDVIRIGFRDIHAQLKSYFSHEGYLSGITLNKQSSALKPEYKKVLKFYGYDVDEGEIQHEEGNGEHFSSNSTNAISDNSTEKINLITKPTTTESTTKQKIPETTAQTTPITEITTKNSNKTTAQTEDLNNTTTENSLITTITTENVNSIFTTEEEELNNNTSTENQISGAVNKTEAGSNENDEVVPTEKATTILTETTISEQNQEITEKTTANIGEVSTETTTFGQEQENSEKSTTEADLSAETITFEQEHKNTEKTTTESDLSIETTNSEKQHENSGKTTPETEVSKETTTSKQKPENSEKTTPEAEDTAETTTYEQKPEISEKTTPEAVLSTETTTSEQKNENSEKTTPKVDVITETTISEQEHKNSEKTTTETVLSTENTISEQEHKNSEKTTTEAVLSTENTISEQEHKNSEKITTEAALSTKSTSEQKNENSEKSIPKIDVSTETIISEQEQENSEKTSPKIDVTTQTTISEQEQENSEQTSTGAVLSTETTTLHLNFETATNLTETTPSIFEQLEKETTTTTNKQNEKPTTVPPNAEPETSAELNNNLTTSSGIKQIEESTVKLSSTTVKVPEKNNETNSLSLSLDYGEEEEEEEEKDDEGEIISDLEFEIQERKKKKEKTQNYDWSTSENLLAPNFQKKRDSETENTNRIKKATEFKNGCCTSKLEDKLKKREKLICKGCQLEEGKKTVKRQLGADYIVFPGNLEINLQFQNGMYDARNYHPHRNLLQRPFLIDDVINVFVPVMTYINIFPYAYIPALHSKALEFPLDDIRYKLLIICPEEIGGLRKLIYDLGDFTLREVVETLRPSRVKATVPTFMVEGFVSLTSSLQKMGIIDVFDPRKSNLSGMSFDSDLHVRNVEQSVKVIIRNYVELLDIQSRTMGGRTREFEFEVWHPFLYFVLDSGTNVALMAGQITNPLSPRIY